MSLENPKLRFTIREIPDGRSQREVSLIQDDISLPTGDFLGGDLLLKFYKTEHFIEVGLNAHARARLICDRSMDEFEHSVTATYKVLFKPGAEESVDQNGAVRPFTGQGQWIDLAVDVRDTIALALPAHPLHPRFLDENGEPIEFETRTFGPPAGEMDIDEIDPRWNGLKTLINQ